MRALPLLPAIASATLFGCVYQPPMSFERQPLQTATLTLCNDSAQSLRVRPNWQIIFPLAPGQCREARVPVGPAVLTASPIVAPPETIDLPATRLEVPAGGGTVRYGTLGAFVGVTKTVGIERWSRCGYPMGLVARPPRPLSPTVWREDLERWMRHHLVCERPLPRSMT